MPSAVVATPDVPMFAGSDLSGWSKSTFFGLREECPWNAESCRSVIQCDFGLLLIGAASNGAGRRRVYDGSACRRLRNGPLSVCLRREASARDTQLVVAEGLRN